MEEAKEAYIQEWRAFSNALFGNVVTGSTEHTEREHFNCANIIYQLRNCTQYQHRKCAYSLGKK